MVRILANASCYLCGNREHLHRHHIDWFHSNNKLSNVIIVCKPCHTELHKVGLLDAKELETLREKVMSQDPSRFEEKETDQLGAQQSLFK
jgi:hypothetical protein